MPFTVVFIESLRDPSPPDVPGENFLFFRRSETAFRFQCFQHVDSVHVGPELGLQAASAKVVIRDAEVVKPGRWESRRFNFIFRRCSTAWISRNSTRFTPSFCIVFTLRTSLFQRKKIGGTDGIDLLNAECAAGELSENALKMSSCMGLCPCLHVHDQLHLLRGIGRIAECCDIKAFFCGIIDHIHLLR